MGSNDANASYTSCEDIDMLFRVLVWIAEDEVVGVVEELESLANTENK